MSSNPLFKVVEHTTPCQHIREYPNGIKPQQAGLQLSIKQYIPLDNPNPSEGDVTIIAAHANGLAKEIYEPLWDEIASLSQERGFKIRSVWIADMSHQGASGVLNENIQGDDPNWFDHSRDLLYMVNVFRDQMQRPIVGVAHSMGSAQLAFLSLMHPRLFTGLVFIEPMIQGEAPSEYNVALPTTLRQDLWPSRFVAEEQFRKNKLFRNWDPRVLDAYLKYGLRDVPTAVYPFSGSIKPGAVTLTTTKHQEAWSYLRSNFQPREPGPGSYYSSVNHLIFPDMNPEREDKYLFHCPEAPLMESLLPFLRPEVLYIFAEKSPMSTPKLQETKMSLTGTGIGGSGGSRHGKVQKVVLKNASHLVPCERVADCAAVTADWLGVRLRQYRVDEQRIREYRSEKSERDMLVVSKRWTSEARKPMTALRDVKGKL